jgi:protein-S-isoprenylcysteine O-methyltransferase Ste14
MTVHDVNGAQKRIHPPLVLLIHLVLAFALGWLIPLPIPAPLAVRLPGLAVVLAGLTLAFAAVRGFHEAHTSLGTYASAEWLVTTGPYRFSRNPIYVGYLCAGIGIPLALGNYWGLILVPVAVVLFERWIIQYEEAYLAHRFGQEYLSYQSAVRRWI